MADLNAMLAADERGEHTQEQFDEFMSKYGDMFPDNPANLEELVDSLARRAAAAERMMRSMSPQQREELAALMAGALEDMDLAREMAQLNEALRARRPDLDWRSRERMRGDEPLGAGEAHRARCRTSPTSTSSSRRSARTTPAPASRTSTRRRCGARSAGGAADDLRELRRLERELEEQGYLNRSGDRLDLTAKAVRRLGQTALRHVFADLRSAGPRRPRRARRRPGGRAHRREPAVAVRRRAAAGRRTHPDQRGARRPGATAGRRDRRGIAAVDRGLRGGRDRPAYVGRGLPARRPVVLDGAARHLGRRQGHRAGAARAGERAVPAGRADHHRLLVVRPDAVRPPSWPAWTPTTCRAPTCSTR